MTVYLYSYEMNFRIARLLERGRILPKYQVAFRFSGPWRIEIREHFDDTGRRHMRRAVAIDPATGQITETIPPLLDAQVLHLDGCGMVVTGFERLHDEALGERLYDFRQTWCAETDNF